jgi:coenzyme Q-binding protein COQ10
MPRFSSKRRVHHTASHMFDLVADVERYPEFVPLCQSLKIRQRTQKADGTEVVVADMTVSFKLVRESFTSRVTLDRPNLKIMVEYLKGPFSNLENRWTFEPRGDAGCDVIFFIAYEFRNRMLALLMGAMLGRTVPVALMLGMLLALVPSVALLVRLRQAAGVGEVLPVHHDDERAPDLARW